MSNFSFRTIKNDEFQSLIVAINLRIILLSRFLLINLIKKKYECALFAIKAALQSILKSIHFTFDGWIFRQNDSNLKMHAHLLNKSWIHTSFFLKFSILKNGHINDDQQKAITKLFEFFDIEDSQ